MSVDRGARKIETSNSQDQLAQTLRVLQVTANRCARLFTNGQLKVEYQVAVSAGATLPWRLVEIHRALKKAGEPRVLRRMHCFRSAESLERSVKERTIWKARDQALVKIHLVQVRASIEKTPAGDAGDAGEKKVASPEGLNVNLQALTATRQALRAQMCLTRPDRVVDLPN
jgi:hypothetical protein